MEERVEERRPVLIGSPPHEPIGRADLQVCPTNRFVGAMREKGLGNSLLSPLPARASQGEDAELDAALKFHQLDLVTLISATGILIL